MRRKKQTVDSRRRTPRQARAYHTIEIIFEATARILQNEGRDAVTTNRIAERAGVSISTLYQYFRDKEEILVALARRELDLHRKTVVSVIAAPPPAPDTAPDRLSVRAFIQAAGARYRRRRLASETLIARGLGAEVESTAQEVAGVIAADKDRFMPGLDGSLSPIALFVVTRAIQGVVGAALREESPFYQSPEFETELVRLARSYLAQHGANWPMEDGSVPEEEGATGLVAQP